MTRPTLDAIALAHHTDKASSHHGYTATYEPLLAHLRDEPITLLELGVGGHEDPALGGASLRMWRDYFSKATIVGLDVEAKAFTIPGVTIVQGSQADPDTIASLAAQFGPFDVVLDDASHLSSLTIRSWELLYPHLKAGAIYVVEDTHAAYHAHYYGGAEACEDPDGTTSTGAPTMMQYLRRLADEVNHRCDGVLFPSRYAKGYPLASVTFRFNLAILQLP